MNNGKNNEMTVLIMMLPLFIVIVALTYLIARNIVQVWVDYRVRIALLERIEQSPELLDEFPELTGASPYKSPGESIQFLTQTGAMLAVIGVVCVVLYATVGSGYWAVGAYWGGVACVALGFLLVLLGLLVRFLSKPPGDSALGREGSRRM